MITDRPTVMERAVLAVLAEGAPNKWCGPLGGGIEGERRGNGVRSKIHLPIIDGRQWHDVPGVDHKS